MQLGYDLAAAARVCQSENYGDWYRDPWGWPELNQAFVKDLALEKLGVTTRGSAGAIEATAFAALDVPKSFLGTRPATVQGPASRLAFTAASMRIAEIHHIDLPDWIFGWRYRNGVLANNTAEFDQYRASQASLGRSAWAAKTDINSFFASVDTATLIGRVKAKVGATASVQTVSSVLEAHARLFSRRGLPQRSTAASWLAHIALGDIDELLDTSLTRGRITGVRRWMDDISFEGPEAELYDLLTKIQASGRLIGLEVNSQKTAIDPGTVVQGELELENLKLIRVHALEMEFSTEYESGVQTYIDDEDLTAAEERVLSDPRGTSRTLAKLVLRSLRHYDYYDRALEWCAVARYLPHAADSLGRYIRRALELGEFDSADACAFLLPRPDSGWKNLPWVQAQHLLAFASADADPRIPPVLEDWLSRSEDLLCVAVATQRLSHASPQLARRLIMERLSRQPDSLTTRVLALGLLQASASRDHVVQALQMHEANHLTLAYLDHEAFKPPDVVPDFARDDAGDT